MLKGTSHGDPDETVGKMSPPRPGPAFEDWTYTVRDVAVNAVMAGCRPEYFPLLLAVASTGKEAISVSDNSFVGALVINGTIRDEIGLNYKVGAMGPYAHANTTIGRAWSLMSINLGNGGKVGTTYMGVVGNPMNLINIVIAENEEESPGAVLVRKGFRKGERRQPLRGLGVLGRQLEGGQLGAEMNYPRSSRRSSTSRGSCWRLRGAEPPIAQFVKNAGYETVEEFEKYPAGAAIPDGKWRSQGEAGERGAGESGGQDGDAADDGRVLQQRHHRHRRDEQQLLQRRRPALRSERQDRRLALATRGEGKRDGGRNRAAASSAGSGPGIFPSILGPDSDPELPTGNGFSGWERRRVCYIMGSAAAG